MKKLLPRVKSRLVVEDWVRRPPKTKEKGVGKAEVWADMVTLERRMLNAMAYMNAKGSIDPGYPSIEPGCPSRIRSILNRRYIRGSLIGFPSLVMIVLLLLPLHHPPSRALPTRAAHGYPGLLGEDSAYIRSRQLRLSPIIGRASLATVFSRLFVRFV
eukprot:3004810-Pyramimonas_sp.AAC.1